MGNELFRQQERHIWAEIVPEVSELLAESEAPEGLIADWYAVPTKRIKIERIGKSELVGNQVDAVKLLEPFFDNPILDGTLRTMDLLNGCGRQCDTCLADAVVPSNILSYESLQRLWNMPEFLAMLQPDSFRYGSSGDVLDHARGPEIVKMTLEATASFPGTVMDDGRGIEKDKIKPHRVKVFTNYRPNLEGRLDKMLQLCLDYPERLKLIISLPLNLSDEVNRRFDKYVAGRAEIFGSGHEVARDGLNHYFGSDGIKNVSFMDVRHPRVLFMVGRTIDEKHLETKVERFDWVESDRELEYRNRGMVKTYLNAEGLWLMVYATMHESHTTRVFTPLTFENLEYLSCLPYHSDFPTPPNWPGGRGVGKSYSVATRLKNKSAGKGKLRRTTVVG